MSERRNDDDRPAGPTSDALYRLLRQAARDAAPRLFSEADHLKNVATCMAERDPVYAERLTTIVGMIQEAVALSLADEPSNDARPEGG